MFGQICIIRGDTVSQCIGIQVISKTNSLLPCDLSTFKRSQCSLYGSLPAKVFSETNILLRICCRKILTSRKHRSRKRRTDSKVSDMSKQSRGSGFRVHITYALRYLELRKISYNTWRAKLHSECHLRIWKLQWVSAGLSLTRDSIFDITCHFYSA